MSYLTGYNLVGRATGRKPSDFAVADRVPGIPFSLGKSWAGNLPITNKKDDPNQLFFWLFPPSEGVGHDDVVVWLNGGPGCSSLEGLFQENGPFKFPFNSTKVEKNPWSWTRLSWVLWVEQPVTVGLTKGKSDITNEVDVAREFTGFLKNFFKTFDNLHGKKFWLTGESYAGKYIPYMSDYIYADKTAKKAGINLQGFGINDPSFAEDPITEDLPAIEFAKAHQKLFHFNDSYIAELESKAEANGIKDYVKKHLVYPPPGPLPIPKKWNRTEFSPWTEILTTATDLNACFNVYDVSPPYAQCPGVSDALGFPPDKLEPSPINVINDIKGLKKAIHADPSITWYECTPQGPFLGDGDTSPGPSESGVLKRAIEKSPAKRNVIQHGLRDYVLIAQGSALAIQNTTWNGKQGFQRKPNQSLLTVNGTKAGTFHTERGLTFVEVINSGHMIPQDDPPTAFKLQKYLLGQIPEAALALPGV
ncbi:Serine carboxypeptidases (lysosomal cathepsin A) [Ceraceosorus bombacis]|uniref:Carboxypeptidase n=1 Tax=Ceraceosorus bombacis TaxID=401625 RepID=A0A0P1BM55_9BASI|nr:Serine carboxypeptidases (lysosomal cathepsin A) [Ceraceosorus bombacis]